MMRDGSYTVLRSFCIAALTEALHRSTLGKHSTASLGMANLGDVELE